jgi:DNA (cytosine-5)-methyltransferase 1
MPKTFIDLFAGIGGFHWALEDLGYECRLAVEKDHKAQNVYKHNFPETKLIGDIRSLTRENPEDEKTELKIKEIRKLLQGEKYNIKEGEISIICGGFPCQPFSKSGDQAGAKDITRGTLFHDILLLTKALKPKYLILENVRNLAGPNHKHTLKTIINRIRKLGYNIEKTPIILSPHQLKLPYGSPQVRERVFILARRKNIKGKKISKIRDLVKSFKKDMPTWDAGEILENTTESQIKKYRIPDKIEDLLSKWEEFVELTKGHNLPGFPIWTEVFKAKKPKIARNFPKWKKEFLRKNYEFYEKLTSDENINEELKILLKKIRKKKISLSRRKFEWQANSAFKSPEDRTLRKLLIQLRPSGIRVKPATHYPALVAITQTTIVGPEVDGNTSKAYRYITPREAAKLQGMHKINFGKQTDALSYKQLGNAVNVGVVKFLAQQLTGATPA